MARQSDGSESTDLDLSENSQKPTLADRHTGQHWQLRGTFPGNPRDAKPAERTAGAPSQPARVTMTHPSPFQNHFVDTNFEYAMRSKTSTTP